jgi:hypothetical protein
MKPTSTHYSIEISLGSEIKSQKNSTDRDSDVMVSRTVKRKTDDGNIEVSVVFSRLKADQVDQIPMLRKEGKIDSNHTTVNHYRSLLKQRGMSDEKIDSVVEKISFSDKSSFKKARALKPIMQRIHNDETGVRADERTEARSLQKTLTKAISVKNLKRTGAMLQEKAEKALAPKEPELLSANLFEFASKGLIEKGALQKIRPPLPATPGPAKSPTAKSKPLPPTPKSSAPPKQPAPASGASSANPRATIVLPELPDLPEDL